MKLFSRLFLLGHMLLLLVLLFIPAHESSAFWALLDVGQGDAVFIHTQTGHNILIDTGPDARVLSALDQVMLNTDRTIDLLFITHPHQDHLGGALYILERYQVGGIVMSDVAYNSNQYALFKRAIADRGILLFAPQAEWDWQLDHDLYLDVLFPFSLLDQHTFKNINNSSLVMMLRAPHSQLLLTGDMEEELELILSLYYGDKLRASDLKVGHHGSKTSSSTLLLNQVRPQEMFISVGANNAFHHPGPRTLTDLKQWGLVKRTDEVGTITEILL